MSGNEEFIYQAVEEGVFELERTGEIWRVANRHFDRWKNQMLILPCRCRRAETQNAEGYLDINITIEGICRTTKAHRLVWRHFRGIIPGDLTINHKDGNKSNNHIDNLELATQSEQALHACHVLGCKPHLNLGERGENHANAKLTDKEARAIKNSKLRGRELAAKYGISESVVSSIRHGHVWTHV